MADKAGLALSIPGVLTSCVECFKYIQLGRNLEDEYETNLLKLNNLGLRLARWGKAMGLNDESTAPDRTDRLDPKAEGLLRAILDLMEKASTKSKNSKPQRADSDTAPEERDLNSSVQSLHKKMQYWMYTRYTSHRNLVNTIYWVISEKDAFDSLIDNLRVLIHDLTTLYPPVGEEHSRLCEREVSELVDDMLVLMHGVAQRNDPLMEGVATAEINQRRKQGHLFEGWDFHGTDKSQVKIGDTVARGVTGRSFSTYKGFKVKIEGRFEIGDNYL
jgi:hypothetical protein